MHHGQSPLSSLHASGHVVAATLQRRGITLLELLIVMVLLVMVTAAAIPIMAPATESRRMRESARLVSSYFGNAQSRAIALGRPVGVMIERLPNNPTASMDLSMVEVPPPYAGEWLDSRVRIEQAGPQSATVTFLSPDDAAAAATLVQPGDQIKFHYRGDLYRIVSLSGGAMQISWTVDRVAPPFTPPGVGVAYQIFRQPVRSSDAPVQLPAGAVIDLNYSGTGHPSFPDGTFASTGTNHPIIITFTPSGAVEAIYHSGQAPIRPTSAIFLLIGKSERVPPGSSPSEQNWADLGNLWVAINPQSGLLTTTENAVGANVNEARAFARSAQNMGGR
jgi:type II secretory pathway pseudopilin PulG